MKNAKNVRNTKKLTDKKMTAILSAAITATVTMAAVTVIAVAGTSGKVDKNASKAYTASTQSAQIERAAEVQNTQDVVKVENKNDVKKIEDTNKTNAAEKKTAVPAVQAQAAQQNAVQAPVAEQKTEAVPVVQAQAEQKAETETVNELGKHPGECGYGYVNELGKHPGESGYYYVAPEQKAAEQKTAAPAVQKSNTPVIPEGEVNDWKTHNAKDGFPIGSYICGNKTLNVVKLDNVNYDVTVKVPLEGNSAIIYSIKAVANGNKMTYTNGVKSEVTYDANFNVIDTKIIDSNHQGTLDASDAGYTWADTEDTTVFVPWMGF